MKKQKKPEPKCELAMPEPMTSAKKKQINDLLKTGYKDFNKRFPFELSYHPQYPEVEPLQSSSWETNVVDDIWSILVEDIQDSTISVGDAYRMKSDLFKEIKKLLSAQQQEWKEKIKNKIMSYQTNGYDFDGDRFYDLLKFLAILK